jgi:hypothetical protein
MRGALLALGLAATLVACGRSAPTTRDAGNGFDTDAPAPFDVVAPDAPGISGGMGGGGAGTGGAGSAITSGAGGAAGGPTTAGTGGNVVGGAVSVSTGGREGVGGATGAGGATRAGGATGSGGAAGEGGATGSDSATGEGGATGSDGGTDEGGASNCGVVTWHTTRAPPELLLVLDRSGSMLNDIAQDCACTGDGMSPCADLSTCRDRWSVVAAAVRSAVTLRPDFYWGLKLFSTPGGDACGVGSGVEVPVGSGSAAAISSVIESTTPTNNTPTAQAISAATAYLKTLTDRYPKTILLITDGQPNCASGSSSTPNVAGTVAEIRAAYAAGFRVYVVGIGPSVGNLDNFAIAGGTEHYYSAASLAELDSAIASITSSVASCTLALPASPPDPNNVAVYLDNSPVAKDDDNGWSFANDMQAIVLGGATCDRLKSSMDATITVLFGCPGMPLPPLL